MSEQIRCNTAPVRTPAAAPAAAPPAASYPASLASRPGLNARPAPIRASCCGRAHWMMGVRADSTMAEMEDAMLEGLVHRKQDRARLETSPARDFLGPFVAALLEKRYRHHTVVRYVFSADRLDRWLRDRGQTVRQLDEAAFAAYLIEIGRRRRGRHGHRCHGKQRSHRVGGRGSWPAGNSRSKTIIRFFEPQECRSRRRS